MPNSGGNTGKRNSEINTELNLYMRQQKSGKVFDSSTAFVFRTEQLVLLMRHG